MHQGGNKSGAHRESICFHLHGRPARMGRRGRDEHPAGRDTRKTKAERGERTVFERRDREIPRAIYGTVIEIPRTMGSAFAKHVRTRDLLSRETLTPRDRPKSTLFLFFLEEITWNARWAAKRFMPETMLRKPFAWNGYSPDFRINERINMRRRFAQLCVLWHFAASDTWLSIQNFFNESFGVNRIIYSTIDKNRFTSLKSKLKNNYKTIGQNDRGINFSRSSL